MLIGIRPAHLQRELQRYSIPGTPFSCNIYVALVQQLPDIQLFSVEAQAIFLLFKVYIIRNMNCQRKFLFCLRHNKIVGFPLPRICRLKRNLCFFQLRLLSYHQM